MTYDLMRVTLPPAEKCVDALWVDYTEIDEYHRIVAAHSGFDLFETRDSLYAGKVKIGSKAHLGEMVALLQSEIVRLRQESRIEIKAILGEKWVTPWMHVFAHAGQLGRDQVLPVYGPWYGLERGQMAWEWVGYFPLVETNYEKCQNEGQ